MDRRKEIVEVKFRPMPRRLESESNDLLKIADRWADKFLSGELGSPEDLDGESEKEGKSVHYNGSNVGEETEGASFRRKAAVNF